MAHHTELLDGVANIAGKSSAPAHVRDDPKIFTGHSVRRGESKDKRKEAEKVKEAPLPEEGEEKGDLMIQYLWTLGTDSIHGMCVANNEAVSYQSKSLEKLLETTKH